MTIRQMSRLYSGIFNLYKTKYSGGEISRQTANNSVKNSTNWIKPKTNLESNFDDAMANLKKSAAEVKNLDFGEEKSVEKVEKFLSDYNDAINFFAENNSVSSRFGRLQNNFSDATYFAKNYAEIGIEVAKDGTMKLDAEKFAEIAEKNSQKVSRTLESLASRAESKISAANLQKNKLFPAVGNNFNFYGNSGLLKNNYFSAGNFLNMFW